MEPLSSFAISVVASIVYDYYKGYKSQYDQEIKDAFEKSLKIWSPSHKDIREQKRGYLDTELKKRCDNPLFEYEKLDVDLKSFIVIYEKVLAEYQTAFSYIKEIRDANR